MPHRYGQLHPLVRNALVAFGMLFFSFMLAPSMHGFNPMHNPGSAAPAATQTLPRKSTCSKPAVLPNGHLLPLSAKRSAKPCGAKQAVPRICNRSKTGLRPCLGFGSSKIQNQGILMLRFPPGITDLIRGAVRGGTQLVTFTQPMISTSVFSTILDFLRNGAIAERISNWRGVQRDLCDDCIGTGRWEKLVSQKVGENGETKAPGNVDWRVERIRQVKPDDICRTCGGSGLKPKNITIETDIAGTVSWSTTPVRLACSTLFKLDSRKKYVPASGDTCQYTSGPTTRRTTARILVDRTRA